MQLAMIGLGRMGANIVRRLARAGHTAVVYDRDPKPGEALAKEGATAAKSLEDVVAKLATPRAIWIMLPAGAATESTIDTLIPMLSKGDTIIDGGNTYYHDDLRHAAALREKGIHHIDVGTSGGVFGLEDVPRTKLENGADVQRSWRIPGIDKSTRVVTKYYQMAGGSIKVLHRSYRHNRY